LIAAAWLVNGLFCKVLNFVPRHEEIVRRILGDEYSVFLTKASGGVWASVSFGLPDYSFSFSSIHPNSGAARNLKQLFTFYSQFFGLISAPSFIDF
jgi:hypothetical protein